MVFEEVVMVMKICNDIMFWCIEIDIIKIMVILCCVFIVFGF